MNQISKYKKIRKILIIGAFGLSVICLVLGCLLFYIQVLGNLLIGIGSGLLSSGIISIIIELNSSYTDTTKRVFYIAEEVKELAQICYANLLFHLAISDDINLNDGNYKEYKRQIERFINTSIKCSDPNSFKTRDTLRFYFKEIDLIEKKKEKILRNVDFFSKIENLNNQHKYELNLLNLKNEKYKKISILSGDLISVFSYLNYIEKLCYIIEKLSVPKELSTSFIYRKTISDYREMKKEEED